ncbi:MAG: ABC transporter ATP-binding protein [Gammaproteobacteria bacterium]|nr:MAG: ABC transporter ATP-binding protein [Gammaproteobacteria bacterium]
MGAAGQPLLQMEGVGFAYGPRSVLEGVDLRLEAGEIYGLVGPDGAGKSTLLRLAAGQLAPAAGRVRILGRPPEEPALRPLLAYMPQGFGLYPDLSVAENLRFFGELHGLAGPELTRREAELLGRVGLAPFAGRRADRLSGGMFQKLALACALVSRPRLMLLDEPTTGVDPLSRRVFWQLLDGVRAEGVGILYATANLEEAERCDRVGLLEEGRIRREGPPLALARVPEASPWRVRGREVRRRLEALRRLPGVEAVFPHGRSATLWLGPGASPRRLGQVLARWDPPLALEPAPPSLHDALLLRLAREQARERQPARAPGKGPAEKGPGEGAGGRDRA